MIYRPWCTRNRYGFELDNTTIYSEWLFEDEKGKEAKLFYRDIDEEDYVNNQKFKEGYGFFDKSNKKINIAQNQLFLWVCDRLANSTISKSILKWFSNFNMLDGTDSNGYMNFTLRKMEDEEFLNICDHRIFIIYIILIKLICYIVIILILKTSRLSSV